MDEGILLSLFLSLRNQLGLDLELAKYGDLLRFAKAGYPMSDRQALHDLCRTLWLVDPRAGHNFDELFEEHWPEEEETDKPTEKGQQKKRKEAKLEEPTSPRKTRTPKQQKPTEKKSKSPEQVYLGYSGGTRISTSPVGSSPQHGFDFSTSFHSVEKRLLHQRLRNAFLSKAKSIDPATIDLGATVSLWAKSRILDHPVYYRRRMLPAKILFLIDHLGSMAPFDGLASFLVQNVEEGLPESEVEVFYFHNNLSSQLFKNPGHTRAVSLNKVIRQFGGKDNALIVFSDAGASKRRIGRERTETAIQFLESVTNQFTRLLWINPMPKERWKENGAAELAEIFPMVEFCENDVRLLPKIFPWDFFGRHGRLDYYDMPSYIDAAHPDAKPYLLWFWENYGQYSYGHWQLLEYAAFLPAFSTELLYKLRKNFPLDGDGKEIPYIAVADLVRSPLCQSLGLGLFQLRDEVKQALPYGSLNAEGELPKRLKLARFLLYYSQDPANDKDVPSPHYRQALRDRASLEENLKPNLERLLELAYRGAKKEGQDFEEEVTELYDLALIAPETKAYLKEGVDLAKVIKDAREKGRLDWQGLWGSLKHQLKPWEPESLDIKIPLPVEEAEKILKRLSEEDINERVYEDVGIDSDFSLLEEIADTYFIQYEEEQLRAEGKLKLQYFFDSFDMIKMVQGAMAYDTGPKFEKDALKRDERKNSVYALAFQGLFGNIRMLSPHQNDFVRKLDKSDGFHQTPRSKGRFLNLSREVVFTLGLEGPGGSKRIDFSKMDEHIKQLVDKGGDIFKANYLLREYTWARRLKYLFEKQILVIEEIDTSDTTKVENSELFREIKTGFDIVRPNYHTNNYYDALAFFDLQQKLNDYIADPSSNPLPVFYASSPVVKEAVKAIRAGHPELFAYWKGDKLIPVVRDSLFFVLEAVFSVGDNTQDFFIGLRDAQGQIKALVKKEYEKYYTGDIVRNLEYSRKQFEEKVREIIDVKFVQEIWIKHRAYQQLVDELKRIFVFKDSDLPIVEERIQETLNETLANAKVNLSNSRKLSAIIDNFQNVSKDIDTYLGNGLSSDVFLDFALMKFGLDERKLPRLQEDVKALIDYDHDNSEFPPAINDVISSLAISRGDGEKAAQFISALTIAWLLDKYELVATLCSDLGKDDFRMRYETALIYGVSNISVHRNKQGIRRTEEIIDTILSHVTNNYKVWIGVGYLYFKLWESKTSLKPDLPEMHVQAWNRQRKSRDYKKYIVNGAFKYTRMAIDFLSNVWREGNADNFQLQNYLYALNQLIYYTTRCGAREEFEELTEWAELLHSYEGNETVWQTRFYRTLSWYYLRKSLNSDDENLSGLFLKEAEQLYSTGRERNNLPKEYTLYNDLNRAIIRVKEDKV